MSHPFWAWAWWQFSNWIWAKVQNFFKALWAGQTNPCDISDSFTVTPLLNDTSVTPFDLASCKPKIILYIIVYFTLPPLFRRILMDFHRTLPIPTDPADSPSDFQWIPSDLTKFRCLSGPSPVKVRWSHLEAENRRTGQTGQSDGLPLDFWWF